MKVLLTLLLLYLYLHNPVFASLGFGSIKLLYPLLLVILVDKTSTRLMVQNKSLIFLYVVLILYCGLRTIAGGDSQYIYSTFVALIELVLMPIVLVSICYRLRVDFVKQILFVGCLSCVITMLAMMIPSIKDLQTSLLMENEYLERNTYRGFGLSDGLTYSYGFVLAIIGILSLNYYKQYKWAIILLPFIALSILVNARTPFIVLALSLVLFLTAKSKGGGNKGRIVTIILIAFLSLPLLVDMSEGTAYFINQFFLEIEGVITGNNQADYSTFDTLFADMFILPNNFFEWVVGTGESLYLAHNSTDIGWLLQLNYGGIVYMLLISIIVCLFLKNIPKGLLLSSFILCILIGNTKGDFLSNSGGFRLISLLSIYYFSKLNKNEQSQC
jgi:hypothetical protein